MEVFMKALGQMIFPMEKEGQSMRMELNTKETLKIINVKNKYNILI